MTAPPVDSRDLQGLVADTEAAVRTALDLPAALPGVPGAPVPGEGLVRIFARLAEIVLARINAVPDKNLLAFLGLVGVDRNPPQPARVPLTFHIAQGGSRARVPAGTTVASAPAEGETDAPVYETDAELILTSTLPVAAFTREPSRDLYRDAASLTTPGGTAVPAFEGALPIPHELYVADPLLALPQPKDVAIRVGPADPGHRWPDAVGWSLFDGVAWQPVVPSVDLDTAAGSWLLSFDGLPAVAPSTVDEVSASWLRARLDTPLPSADPADESQADVGPGEVQQSGLPADAAFADTYPLDPVGPLAPFGVAVPRTAFVFACERAFSKPGATVTIDVAIDATSPAMPAPSLALTWSYWNGGAWTAIGTTAPGADEEPQGETGFVDGTRAFTRDGTVAFSVPADWRSSTVGGVDGYWLQVAIADGDWGEPPAYAAPQLQSLTVAYTWPLPRIETLTRRVAMARRGLQPDGALFGLTPLDLTKVFQPFGPKPAFNDVFYLAADEALALPGAKITLTFAGKTISAKGTPVLAWEVYDGATGLWTAATVDTDETAALTFPKTTTGRVVLHAPAVPAPVSLAGLDHHWLRARLVSGNYGTDADFTVTPVANAQPIITPVKASWDPPSLSTLTIDYDFADGPAAPAAVATVNDFRAVAPAAGFTPFTVPADTRPTFYLGTSADFGNDTTTLFFEVADVTDPAAAGLTPPEPAIVVWEYFSPNGWQPLGTRDDTRGFRVRGLVTFIAPADLVPSTEFGVTACWLRARWERGGFQGAPKLARVLTNTTWASQVATVRDELLGSSTGEERQVFRTARAPVLPGQEIHVRELGRPSAAELAEIVAEEGDDAVSVVQPTVDGAPETWVRWHAVVDFYGSGPRSRHYVLDWTTGEVRFGDGRRGLPPPQGRSNVRATLYQTGGGATGNRGVGAIVQLKTAVPYVDKVTNPLPAEGGTDAESLDAVRDRGPRQLRHGNRAVTIADVEDLALEASPGIARVLGVPATDAADAGRVGVVVVPAATVRQPVPSVELIGRVSAYVEDRLPPTVELWVAGPGWLEISVTAEVVPELLEEATDVQGAVRAALDAFLHPLTGGHGGAGWPFGRTPRRSDLLALIEGVPGVDHVRGLSLDQTQTQDPPVAQALLVYSADHTITMAGAVDGGGAA